MRPGGLDGSLDNGVGTSTGIDDDNDGSSNNGAGDSTGTDDNTSEFILFLCRGDVSINKSPSDTPLDSRVCAMCVNGAGLDTKLKGLRGFI